MVLCFSGLKTTQFKIKLFDVHNSWWIIKELYQCHYRVYVSLELLKFWWTCVSHTDINFQPQQIPLHWVMNLFATSPLIPGRKLLHARTLPAIGHVQLWAAFHMWSAVAGTSQRLTWCKVPPKAVEMDFVSFPARYRWPSTIHPPPVIISAILIFLAFFISSLSMYTETFPARPFYTTPK